MSVKSRLFLAALPVAAAFLPLLAPAPADAIPAFARQHKTECSTCHTIYPELNEFGEAYLRNSYVYPGAAKPAAEAQRTEGLWLSGIPEQLPVSLAASLDIAYNQDAADRIDLSSRSIRLHAGGNFRETAGFFITYDLYAEGLQRGTSNNPSNNTTDLNELIAIWRHVLGTPVNLRIGRFEPKLSLWKKTNRVITVPSFASTTYSIGRRASDIHASEFTVDNPQDALEASAVLRNRLLLAAGVVDRDGQNRKDGYGHVSIKFGGTDFAGNEPEIDMEKEESVFDYLALTLGGFGYFGTNAFISNGVAEESNNFYRAGVEFDLLYKRAHLKGSAVTGRDSNPTFTPGEEELESKAYAVEGSYMLGAPIDLIGVLRYEYQEGLAGKTHRYIPAVAYAPLQNTRVSLQYNHEDGPVDVNRTTLASLSFSF